MWPDCFFDESCCVVSLILGQMVQASVRPKMDKQAWGGSLGCSPAPTVKASHAGTACRLGPGHRETGRWLRLAGQAAELVGGLTAPGKRLTPAQKIVRQRSGGS